MTTETQAKNQGDSPMTDTIDDAAVAMELEQAMKAMKDTMERSGLGNTEPPRLYVYKATFGPFGDRLSERMAVARNHRHAAELLERSLTPEQFDKIRFISRENEHPAIL